MKNKFGIEVQSTIEPKKRMSYEDWADKYKVGLMHQKRDFNARSLMLDYDFKKLSEKKDKKKFGIIHKLISFA
jgi:hypothetical protein